MAYPVDEVDLSKLEEYLIQRGCFRLKREATNENVGGVYMVYMEEYEGLKIDSIKKEEVLGDL